LRACVLAPLLASALSAPCIIPDKTVVAVYADSAGGVGEHSVFWTRSFFDWWGETGDALRGDGVVYFEHAAQVRNPSAPAGTPLLY